MAFKGDQEIDSIFTPPLKRIRWEGFTLLGDNAYKANIMSQAALEAQTSFVTPEARGQEASSERDSLDDDDVERNADLYIFNLEVSQH